MKTHLEVKAYCCFDLVSTNLVFVDDQILDVFLNYDRHVKEAQK